MKKKVFFIILALSMLGVVSYLYICNFLLPVKLKEFITTQFQKTTGHRVEVSAVDFKMFEGFKISGLKVYEKSDPTQLLASADRLTFKLLLLPIIREKAVIIPSFHLKRPLIHLARDSAGAWNYADLFPRKSAKKKLPYQIFVKKIEVTNGAFKITDQQEGSVFSENIQDVNLRLNLTASRKIAYQFSGKLPDTRSVIAATGEYVIAQKKAAGIIELENINLNRYQLYAKTLPILNSLGGNVSAKIQFTGTKGAWQIKGKGRVTDADITVAGARVLGDMDADVPHFKFNKNQWKAAADIHLGNGTITLSNNTVIAGTLSLSQGALAHDDNRTSIAGEIVLQQGSIKHADNQSYEGNFHFSQGKIILDGNDFSAGGDLAVTGVIARINETRLWTNMVLKDLRLSKKGTDFTAEAQPSLTKTLLTFPQEGQIEGSISSEKIKLSLREGIWQASGNLALENFAFQIDKEKMLHGITQMNVTVKHDPQGVPATTYAGDIFCNDASLTGLPAIGNLDKINGTIAFENDLARTQKLSLLWQDNPLLLSGSVRDFANPMANLGVKTAAVDIAQILALFSDPLKKSGITLNGKTQLTATYQGSLTTLDMRQATLAAGIMDATLSLSNLPTAITQISGDVDLKNKALTWKNLTGIFQEERYTLNGNLTDFDRPFVETTLASAQGSLRTTFDYSDRMVSLQTFAGQWLNSSFDIKGNIATPEKSAPRLRLSGEFAIDLKDIAELPATKNLSALNLRGILNTSGTFSGSLDDWRRAVIKIQGSTPKASILDYPLETVSLTYDQSQERINQFDIIASVYGGLLSMVTTAQLDNSSIPFETLSSLNKLNLALYQKDKQTKNASLSGLLDVNLKVAGKAESWKEMRGTGSLSIKNGYLGSMKFIEGILSALIIIPEFKDVLVTDLSTDFTVEDQRITTKTANLKGKAVTFTGSGWIDFDKRLHFDIYPRFSQITIAQSHSAKKGIMDVFRHAISIKCDGTIDKPDCGADKSPLKVIGKTTSFIKDGVGGMIDEMF